MKVSCLGPEGSYSELAAKKIFPEGEIVLCPNFSAVTAKLISRETDYAVLPIENSIQGGVLQNLDLLATQPVFATEELVLRIDHRLATKAGTLYSDITRIYSHEQAIGQCSEFLKKNFPQAQIVFTDSTAKSLSLLDGHSAGIVGSHVVRENVVVSEENIADEKNNFTRFLCLTRSDAQLPSHSEKLFFTAICTHKPGSLAGMLQTFARGGFNLTRIESRPIKDVFGEYRFFIEFAGDIGDERVRRALEEVKQNSLQFKLIGAYR